jgi:AraC-like DNA-binding protein
MAGATVAAGISARVLELAVARGADRAALLEASQIEPERLRDHDARIPLARHMALIEAAKRLTGDAAFALHYGEAVDLAEVSVVGLIGHASETMLDAFAQLARYSRLMADLDMGPGERFQLVRDDAGLWIVDNRSNPDLYPELTEIAFAQMVSGTRRFGDTPFVLAVELAHADPGTAAEYERILGAPVRFGRSRNAMRIDPAWLTRRIAVGPSYAFGILTRHAEGLLERLDREETMRGRVERLILPVIHKGGVSMAGIAERLGCSRDTLYRRLKEEGTSFEATLGELRRRLALEYLAAGKASVNEIAYLTGFSDPAAFSRAVKRWTGHSPGRLRGTPSACLPPSL